MFENNWKKFMLTSCLVLLGALPVFSAPITWGVSGTFVDGGTLSGSFIFDATTVTYSAISVSVTAGSGYSSATFTFLNPAFPNTDKHLEFALSAGNLTGLPYLFLNTVNAMTDAGGTIALSTIPPNLIFSAQVTCSDATCAGYTNARQLSSGSVTTVPEVPEPATLSLLLLGGLAFAGVKKLTLKRS